MLILNKANSNKGGIENSVSFEESMVQGIAKAALFTYSLMPRRNSKNGFADRTWNCVMLMCKNHTLPGNKAGKQEPGDGDMGFAFFQLMRYG